MKGIVKFIDNWYFLSIKKNNYLPEMNAEMDAPLTY